MLQETHVLQKSSLLGVGKADIGEAGKGTVRKF